MISKPFFASKSVSVTCPRPASYVSTAETS